MKSLIVELGMYREQAMFFIISLREADELTNSAGALSHACGIPGPALAALAQPLPNPASPRPSISWLQPLPNLAFPQPSLSPANAPAASRPRLSPTQPFFGPASLWLSFSLEFWVITSPLTRAYVIGN